MKASEILKKIAGKEPVCYYTDHAMMKNWERVLMPGIIAGNSCLSTYRKIAGLEIKSMEDLGAMIKNPDEFYREQFYQANQKDFATLSKLKLDYKTLIELPEGFNDVRSKAASLAKFDLGNYEMKDEGIVYSTKSILRRDAKANLIATTQEEKARLKISLDMIEVFQRIESDLQGALKPNQFKAVSESKAYAKPLPHCLKIVADENGKAILIPNPAYVSEGYAGLPGFNLTKAVIRRAEIDGAPKLGVPHLKICLTMASGSRNYYLVEQKDEAKYRAKFGAAAEWLPGLYNEQDKPWGKALERVTTKVVSTIGDVETETLLKSFNP